MPWAIVGAPIFAVFALVLVLSGLGAVWVSIDSCGPVLWLAVVKVGAFLLDTYGAAVAR